MRLREIVLAATCLPIALPAHGQAMIPLSTDSGPKTPVPVDPPADPRDTPESIAKDAARDLKDARFYNKPGATRAQYDADWQQCRLIARGSRSPSGSVPYYYNPAVVSPLAAGIGAGIGGAIAAAIAEGVQRRENRRNCLLIRGWRLVEVDSANSARVAAMTDVQRSAYLDTMVGAPTVAGKITERSTFTMKGEASLHLDAPVQDPGVLFLGKKIDPAVPLALDPGQAAVVLAHLRPTADSANRSLVMQLARYDMAGRDVIYKPKDWKKTGDKTTYVVDLNSGNRKAVLEVQVQRMTPGDYVIRLAGVGPVALTTSYCFGAPVVHVAAGEVLYLGDFIPITDAVLPDGEKVSGVAYQGQFERTRAILARSQPALAERMRPATLHNHATFACSGVLMDRWDLPSVAALPEPAAASSTHVAG